MTLALATATVPLGAFAPSALADRSYHTEHLALAATDSAPLHSGFVQNIKAQGPHVYAVELYVVNGGLPKQTFTVVNNFFYFDPDCSGSGLGVDHFEMATLETNAAGNGTARAPVAPWTDPLPDLEHHGVKWTLENTAGEVVYETACTEVILD